MYGESADKRNRLEVVDMELLVPKNHLVRKIDAVMDYEWIYDKVRPYYKEGNCGRPGIDPVILVKMVLLQHLFGIPSLRQTYAEIEVNMAYRWFLGLTLTDPIPHFATVSYSFCHRFPPELSEEIFAHVLNKAVNNRMIDTSMIAIDGTHIKASANKKKKQKELVAKTARSYDEQLRAEVNEDREQHHKKPFGPKDGDGEAEMKKTTVSTTDLDCGMFVKGEHERQFAYEAHTACDSHGFVVAVEVTAGNVHDSVAFDAVYDKAIERFPKTQLVAMHAAYKTAWICKKVLDGGRIPILPYTRTGCKPGMYRPWEYRYDEAQDCMICPRGESLSYATTGRDGYREYKSDPKICYSCPNRCLCTKNAKFQKTVRRHVWGWYLDVAEAIRKTPLGKDSYAKRKETIERVFADAKEKHGMRYTHHRGLERVTAWVVMKYAAMNLKKLARWSWPIPSDLFPSFVSYIKRLFDYLIIPVFA